MNLFESRYFHLNSKLLAAFGLWPFDSNVKRSFRFGIVLLLFGTAVPAQVAALVESYPDSSLLFESLPSILCVALVLTKACNMKLRETVIRDLLIRISVDWTKVRIKEEFEIVENFANRSRIVTIYYWMYVWISTAFFTMLPRMTRLLDILVPLNESRPLQLLFRLQYYVDEEKYYEVLYLHQTSLSFIAMTIVVAIDTMSVLLVFHPCSSFTSITYRLGGLLKGDRIPKQHKNAGNFHESSYWLIRNCIHLHQDTLDYCEALRVARSTPYLVEITINMFVISITAIQIVARPDDALLITRYIFLTLGQVCHMFFNCLPGQLLIDHSLALRETVYGESHWYKLSLRSRKLLLFMMMRSSIPCEMTAGKFFIMSMQSFRAFISASMSYFTMFTSVR